MRQPERALDVDDVTDLVSLSRAMIYSLVKTNSFPLPRLIGPRKRRWLLSDIEAWLRHRPPVEPYRRQALKPMVDFE
jgi:predicted DNA-binding transcriptional regulator AlpA